MRLLWLELKKLAVKALRLLALLVLTLSVLGADTGASVIVAAPDGQAQAGATRLVHLQLFGGLIHIHESPDDSHVAKPPPAGVIEETLPFQEDPDNTGFINRKYYGNQTFLDKSDFSLESLLVLSVKYQGVNVQPQPHLQPVSRAERASNENLLPDPFLPVPLRPPVY